MSPIAHELGILGGKIGAESWDLQMQQRYSRKLYVLNARALAASPLSVEHAFKASFGLQA